MVSNLPVKKFRSGAIEGVIWANKRKQEDGSEIEFKTVTLRRSWKDKTQDIWREEKLNLRKTDLPKIQLIIQKLQEDLYLSNDNKGDDSDE
ncbi:MAG TPA: hypothetical protein VJH37_00010 [Candidatus Nanoarchaeia archaeon]|nr:hypothetical protein [Candidatus Nanoarchaeia archaeon]